jgi:subtilisin family serine protease
MRHVAATLVAISLLAWPAAATPAAATDLDWSKPPPSPARGGGLKDPGPGEAAPAEPTGRLIVRFRAGTSTAARDQARREAGLTHVADVALPNSELVEPAAGGLRQAMARLDADAAVELVEPEYRRTLQGGPTNEDLFDQQWSLHNTGQVIETYAGAPDVDMNVPGAWEITTGDTDLVVAVLDDGVDFTHPDLAGRQWVNPGEVAANGVDDDANGYIDDVNGWDFCNDDNTVHEGSETHGTHVSGSIAANANGTGIVGVAPSVRIMAVKIFDGGATCGTDQQAIDAIAYAAANGALIINASWGSAGASQSLGDAIEAVPDVLVVAAAGNGGPDGVGDDNDVIPFYPASYDLPNILSVAAIHNEGHLSNFSNFGATSVDLSAPGEDVLSSVTGASFAYASGTSMAAANTSGVAALAASARPSLLGDAPSLREHLIATAKALPSTFGWVASPRLVDARAAVVDRPDIRRLAGADRFATAAAITKATYVPFVPYLFIATGAGFPDALAGGAVAAQTGSPLLLVKQNSVPAATLAEIQRLQPSEIYVLGGTSVVSNTVLGQLDGLSFNGAYRIAGANRYATAAAVSQGWAPGVPNVFIATGLNFPDALAGVPASGVLGGPLLLTATTWLPNETKLELQRLNPARVVILGGSTVVSNSVASQIGTSAGAPVVRWAGADRYATAATVSANSFGSRAQTAFVANGLSFPDALAGGPSGGAFGGPMLLTQPTSLPSATSAELLARDPARIFVLGGTAVVSSSVVTQIDALFP